MNGKLWCVHSPQKKIRNFKFLQVCKCLITASQCSCNDTRTGPLSHIHQCIVPTSFSYIQTLCTERQATLQRPSLPFLRAVKCLLTNVTFLSTHNFVCCSPTYELSKFIGLTWRPEDKGAQMITLSHALETSFRQQVP